MTALYRQDIASCLAERIGAAGLSPGALSDSLKTVAPAVERLKREHAEATLPLLQLPARRDDLRPIAQAAKRHARFATNLVLGIGGSSLGGQTLAALAPRADNLEDKLVFLDSIDPQGFDPWLELATRRSIGFVVISKSGSTAETAAQALASWTLVSGALGAGNAADHFTVITEPKDNPLRRMAQRHRLALLDHDAGIGGRYSVLSVVGLLPAQIARINIRAVRAGAAQALDRFLRARQPADCPATLGAALNLAFAKSGRTIQVVMPYADALRPFALWHAQLWAESLGKGGHGTTPVPALGPVDQHSQLQLWLDGPRDKLFTLIVLDRAGTGRTLAAGEHDQALSYLSGRTMGDLLDAEQEATAATLANRHCPVRLLRLPQLDERALGALFMHFMIETILAGYALGLDPFDQPAVEDGKRLARERLAAGRQTTDDRRQKQA